MSQFTHHLNSRLLSSPIIQHKHEEKELIFNYNIWPLRSLVKEVTTRQPFNNKIYST